MYLIVFFIVSICIAVWVLLFLNKPHKTERTGREARRGGKQFVFSDEKPFVASLKTAKPEKMQPEKPDGQTMKKETPAAIVQKITQPKHQAQEPQVKERPPKTNATINDSSEKLNPQSNQDNLDFDHLSDLIDNFFSEEKNKNN